MSLKRSHSGGKSFGGAGGDAGGKIDRQDLFDELKRLSGTSDPFTPVDVALAIGAAEAHVSKALLGLAAEGYLERADAGRYRAVGMADMSQAEFVKAYARASKVDSTRQRDLSEIGRLKQNNDVMRQRLLQAIAERDHYLAALKARGIDAGPPPVAPPAPTGAVVPASVGTTAGSSEQNGQASPGVAAPSAIPAEADDAPESEHSDSQN
jgi:hypothetical protein